MTRALRMFNSGSERGLVLSIPILEPHLALGLGCKGRRPRAIEILALQARTGCTERLVSHNLAVRNTARGSVSHEVEARGVNFGGRELRIPYSS